MAKCFIHKVESCFECMNFGLYREHGKNKALYEAEVKRMTAETLERERIAFIRELFKLRFEPLILGSGSKELLKRVWEDCKEAWDTKPDDC